METISENLGITLEFIQPPDNEKWGSVKVCQLYLKQQINLFT